MGLFSRTLSRKGNAEQKSEDSRERVRQLRAELRQQERHIDRDIRKIEMEEKKVVLEIKTAAKRKDATSCKILAAEVVRSRKAIDKLITGKAQINSVAMALMQTIATDKMISSLDAGAQVLSYANKSIALPKLNDDLRRISVELTKMGLMQEMMDDAVDDFDEDIEKAADAEVDKILAEVTAEYTSKMPATVQKDMPATERPKTIDQGVGMFER